MKLRTEFFLSWKYFKPKRSAVSVITLISVIGVALGVAVLIVVLAVMSGLKTARYDLPCADPSEIPLNGD